MADMMTFPDTVEEFMEQYKITDTDHVYTNGVEMVPIFRMKQWFEHLTMVRTQMSAPDRISRQAAIDAILGITAMRNTIPLDSAIFNIKKLPSAQPTLYGYQIEHLAYIARVMQKEGVTAEYAVRTFDDMSRVIRMIIEEAQQKVEETLNGRFNQQTGGQVDRE